MAADASGLPLELWRGLDLKTLEGLLAQIEADTIDSAYQELGVVRTSGPTTTSRETSVSWRA